MLFFSTENSLERNYWAETDTDQYLFDHCSPSHAPQLACCFKGDSKVLLYVKFGIYSNLQSTASVGSRISCMLRLINIKHSSSRVFAWVSSYYQSLYHAYQHPLCNSNKQSVSLIYLNNPSDCKKVSLQWNEY